MEGSYIPCHWFILGSIMSGLWKDLTPKGHGMSCFQLEIKEGWMFFGQV